MGPWLYYSETFTLMMQLLHLHTPTSIPALQEFVNSNSPPIPPCFLPSDLEFCTHIALFQTAGLRLYTLNMSQIMQLFYSSGCLLALAYLGKIHSTKIQGLVKNYDAKNMSTMKKRLALIISHNVDIDL